MNRKFLPALCKLANINISFVSLLLSHYLCSECLEMMQQARLMPHDQGNEVTMSLHAMNNMQS